jgi:hypothetical protein
MPMKLGLLVSIVAGGAVAVAADAWRSRAVEPATPEMSTS